LNGTPQLLVCADSDDLLGENVNITKDKRTKAVLGASNEDGLEVNTQKSKKMFMTRNQTVGQNHNIKVANKSFKTVAKFKILGIMVINQNDIHEEIKSRLN
jgi:hypothetical protein